MIKVQYKQGLSRPIDAEVVYRELEQIRSSGSLTPDAVIAAATPDDAPLHNCFSWDMEKNHLAHLRWQARTLIASIEVHVVRDDRPAIIHRQYVTTKSDGVRSYERIDVALQREDLRAEVLDRALADIERTMGKYSQLTELSALCGLAMDEIAILRQRQLALRAEHIQPTVQQ